jgi:hypothetical protein
MSKGTADKLKRLFNAGTLQPYVDYITTPQNPLVQPHTTAPGSIETKTQPVQPTALGMPKIAAREKSDVDEISQVEIVDPKKYPNVEREIFDPLRTDEYRHTEQKSSSLLKTRDIERLMYNSRFQYPFNIEVKTSRILIESLQIRTSDPEVPFRFILSESNLHVCNDWEQRDMLQLPEISRETLTVPLGAVIPYMNRLRQTKLFCGLVIFFNRRPYHFDLQPEEDVKLKEPGIYDFNNGNYNKKVRDYFRKPIAFTITVRYLPDNPVGSNTK